MDSAAISVARMLFKNTNSTSTLIAAADEHGVANVVDGRAHQLALIVYRCDVDSRRRRFAGLGQGGVQFTAKRPARCRPAGETPSASRHLHHCSEWPCCDLHAKQRRGQVSQADRLIVLHGDHTISQRFRINRLAVG